MSDQSEIKMRAEFEEWYSTHAFNYTRNPTGSRDCSLQWDSWEAAMNTRAPSATSVGVDEVARDAERLDYLIDRLADSEIEDALDIRRTQEEWDNGFTADGVRKHIDAAIQSAARGEVS